MNKKLLKQLNAFVKSFDSNLSVVYSDDFFIEWETNRISVTLNMDATSDRFYNYLVREYIPKVELEVFIWSLLHEVGHFYTMEEAMSDEAYDESGFIRAMVTCDELLTDEQQEALYFNLIEEKMATIWAIEWAEENLEELNKWIAKFEKAFKGGK
jgi:hypothetical protein